MDLKVPIVKSRRIEELTDGIYLGILYRIIEKGSQPDQFQTERYSANNSSQRQISADKPIRYSKRVLLSWVLPEILEKVRSAYKPILIHKDYRMYLTEGSHLYQDILKIRGIPFTDYEINEQFDLLSLLGLPCWLKIRTGKDEKTTKVYRDIQAIEPVLDPLQYIPESPYEYTVLTFKDWDWSIYDSLSKSLQQELQKALEFKTVKPLS